MVVALAPHRAIWLPYGYDGRPAARPRAGRGGGSRERGRTPPAVCRHDPGEATRLLVDGGPPSTFARELPAADYRIETFGSLWSKT